MSKYNSYARRVDEIARGLFTDYNKALEEYNKAEAYYKANKRPDIGIWNTDSEKIVRAAKAEAEYYKAKERLDFAKNALQDGKRTIRDIQKEFKDELEADIRINPACLDMAAIEILKSGVLRSDEYSSMVAQYASNPTMARMVATYAEKALENASDRTDRGNLIKAIDESKKVDGGERVSDFDNLCVTFDKCANNPTINSYWGEFTANMVENF